MRSSLTITGSRRPKAGQISLAFATCALALMMQTLAPKAQTAPAPGYNPGHALPYKHAIVHKFKQLMTGLNNSECIEGAKGNRVAFLGIPPKNLHLGEFVRKSLNTQALEQLNNDLGFAFRFNSTQNIGLVATLNDNSVSGQNSLQQTIITLLKTSPYVLAMQTMRPRKDVIQIKMDLLARGKGGVTLCSKSAELFVLLSNFTIIDAAHIDSRENRNFIQSKWIYEYVLKRFFDDITKFKRLRVINNFAMQGRCELRNKGARQFRDSYFKFGDSSSSLYSINKKDWPRLRLEKSGRVPDPQKLQVTKGDGILYLRYSLSGIDRDVVDISLELYAEGDVINATHISMLIDPRNVAGCTQSGSDPLVNLINGANRKGLNFAVQATKEKFKVGSDHVEFKINADQPLYFHCLSIGADGTSRLAFPWNKSQLNEPFGAGQTRTYPQDFGLTALVLQQDARELFGCYASPTRLPEQLENRWMAAHPFNAAKNNKSGILTFDETKQFLSWLNATPNTGSAFTWLRSSR